MRSGIKALPGLSPQLGAAKPRRCRSSVASCDFRAEGRLSAGNQTGRCVSPCEAMLTLPGRCVGIGPLPALAACLAGGAGAVVWFPHLPRASAPLAGRPSSEGSPHRQMCRRALSPDELVLGDSRANIRPSWSLCPATEFLRTPASREPSSRGDAPAMPLAESDRSGCFLFG